MVEPKEIKDLKNVGLTAYIFKPMWVTLKHVIKRNKPEDWWTRRPCTVLYPHEKIKINRGFRGLLSVQDELCIGCGKCERICPNDCLEMVKVGDNRRPKAYTGRCMFCGLCEEVCPTGAFYLTEEYELASIGKEEMVLSPEMLDSFVPEYRKDIKLVLPDTYPKVDREACISCRLCAKNCPQEAILMVAIPGTEKIKADGSKGRAKEIPIIDYSKCVWCELCVENCKPEAIDFVLADEAKRINEDNRKVTCGAPAGGGTE